MKNKKSSKVLGKLNKNSNQRNIVINGLRVSQGDKMTVINCDKEFIFKTVKAQYFKNSVANFCCTSGTFGATGVIVKE